MKPARPLGDNGSGPTFKYILVALLSLGSGFVAFNLSSILSHTHASLLLSHSHRTSAMMSFVGDSTTSTTTDHVADTEKEAKADTPHIEKAADKAADQAASKATAGAAAGSGGKTSEDKKLQEVTAILSTRVCGSPAVDGYMHVVPKCLEESPTNKWWQEYYKSGGKQTDLVVHIEEAADFDGLAVKWGLKNTVKDANECGQQCLNHMPHMIQGPYDKLPCNAFAFCPDEVCFEPDAHHHTKGDCWLKFTEGPAWVEVNMRGDLPSEFRARHPNAPARTPWISGVLLPKGVKPTNGTFGPRWKW